MTALHRPRTVFDVLQWPLIGRLLRWRYGRLMLQLFTFGGAAILLIDGLYGSRFTSGDTAPENLATVISWVHYRGLVVLALLFAGNLFCMACPFTIPRTLAKRLSIRGRRFPKALRNKWLAIAGLLLMFFLYEWLDLWASPALTAWVIVAYFLLSFAMEAWFTESAFCKYVCPLGTFNFVYATASPTQIGVHNPQICRTCVGKECINGSYAAAPVIQIDQIALPKPHTPQGVLGCGTELFAPQIQSNLDCTFCLDCVRACPHENVGLFVRSPLKELTAPEAWRTRWDITFLVAALAFMGMTNAFGMVPPVYALMADLSERLSMLRVWGWSPRMVEALVLLIIFGTGNLLLPMLSVLFAATWTRTATRTAYTLRETAAVFAPAFVPIGFGIWVSHYLFHFLVGIWTVIPATQSFLGLPADYSLVGFAPNSLWLSLIEIGALMLGFTVSLFVAQKRAVQHYRRQAFVALMPWAFLFLLMMLISFYIMGLPMEMRGTVELFN